MLDDRLHRHSFELTRSAGKATAGVIKDVVMLGGFQELEFDFVADNPGPTLFHCHAPASPVQLARDEPLARELFPLAERLEPEPWMGRRPCLPDMVPVIGKGERHPNGERERLQICMSAGNAVSEPAGGVTRWLREGLLLGHHLGEQAAGHGT